VGEVEGQRRIRDTKLIGNRAGRHPVRTRLDEQAEEGEAMFLRERTQGGDG